jgi:hypothetical protein
MAGTSPATALAIGKGSTRSLKRTAKKQRSLSQGRMSFRVQTMTTLPDLGRSESIAI